MRIHHGSGIVDVSWEEGSDLRRVEVAGLRPKSPYEADLQGHVIFEDVGENSVECSWKAGRSFADQDLDSTDLRDLARELLRMADRLDGVPLPTVEEDPVLNDFLSVYDPKKKEMP